MWESNKEKVIRRKIGYVEKKLLKYFAFYSVFSDNLIVRVPFE